LTRDRLYSIKQSLTINFAFTIDCLVDLTGHRNQLLT
jgi:hypothetical protein